MAATMRALVGGAGPDWEERDVDVPTPRAAQIRVRVRAAGLNRADLLMLQGSYNPGGRRRDTFVAGMELAGEVDAVGEMVSAVRVGDRVMGSALGAFAPFALMDPRHAIAVPSAIDWTDAAALPVGLSTEHDALVTQAGFGPGDRVLIVGATSGVGLVGVQLAKALGASLVIATTTSGWKTSALTGAGADLVVDTTTENLAETVVAATDGAGVDIALDHVGGEHFGDLFGATRPRGTIVNIGRLGGPTATINLDQLAFRRLRAQGTTFSIRTADERAEVCAALLPEVLPAVADGRIRAVIDRVFPFDRAQEAADRMRSKETVGKIVIEL